jgi:acetyl-CoA acyltransferase
VAGADPALMHTAPIPATQKILARSGLDLDKIGAFEVNVAFAPVPWHGWPTSVPTRSGSTRWAGRSPWVTPLGASGVRLITALVHPMRDKGVRCGLQTMWRPTARPNAAILELL